MGQLINQQTPFKFGHSRPSSLQFCMRALGSRMLFGKNITHAYSHVLVRAHQHGIAHKATYKINNTTRKSLLCLPYRGDCD